MGMDPTDTPTDSPPSQAFDTSEFDSTPPAEEPTPEFWDSQSERIAPPVVPFVYDESSSEPVAEPMPEPVSARIQEPEARKGPRTALFLAGSIVAGIIGALLTIGVLAATGTFDEPDAVAAPPTTVATGAQASQTTEIPPPQIINGLGAAVNPTAVAAKAIPSIVTVTVANAPTDEDGQTIAIGSGSGVVMSAEGYIITNHHVIEGGDTFSVEFEDGRIYEAKLIGSDDLTDIAVLQIDASELTPVDFGSADSLSIGDPAVAIGNPLGQEGGASVTVGIISAFNRRVDFADETSLSGMIQTDAAINSGSSGGALFDVDGNLIGITSAIGVSQAGPEGIGYAIPIELVDRITAEIIETGDVVHPFLGVRVGTYLDQASDGALFPGGGLIDTIEGTDSAAGLAGLQVGDVIIGIGGKTITDQSDLVLAVRLYRVGDEVEFTAKRNGETMTFVVIMGQRPVEFQG
jgi:serine protease Do